MKHKYPSFISNIEISHKENSSHKEDRRYWLKLKLDNKNVDSIVVLLKNPSKANKLNSDHTINKVCNYIYKNISQNKELINIGEIIILNLIPIYQTYSNLLHENKSKIIDKENIKQIDYFLKLNQKVIIAWGNHPKKLLKEYEIIKEQVFELFKNNKNKVFFVDKLTKFKNPKHAQIWSYKDLLFNYEYTTIKSISINKEFWIDFNHNRVSFRFGNLPKDLHYTIAYNESSPEVNLHLSKNNINAEKNNKPKLDLLKIKKSNLVKFAPYITQILLNLILEPIDMKIINLKNSNFISFDNLISNNTYSNKLYESFKEVSSIKRRNRLKVTGKIDQKLSEINKNKEIQDAYFELLVETDKIVNEKITGGILLLENETVLHVIKVYNEWYKFRTDITKNELLEHFIGKKLSDDFFIINKEAIININSNDTYDECKKWNNPLCLELKKKNCL